MPGICYYQFLMSYETSIEEGVFSPEILKNIDYQNAPLTFANYPDASINPLKYFESLSDDRSLSDDPVESVKPSYADRIEVVTNFITYYQQCEEVQKALLDYRLNPRFSLFDQDPLRQYLKQTLNYPFLKSADEIILFKAIDRGVEVATALGDVNAPKESEHDLIEATIAFNKIYYSNLRLVINATQNKFRKQNSPSSDQLDYIQEGNIALSEAIKRFNVSMGYKFSTYATWWLKQKIQRAHSSNGRAFNIPTNAQSEFNQVLITRNELFDQMHREPSSKEIAQITGKKERVIEELIISCSRYASSLHEPLEDGSGREIADVIETQSDGIEPFIDHLIIRDQIETAIQKADLSREELLVLSLRYHIYFDILADDKVSNEGTSKTYSEIFNLTYPDKVMGFKPLASLVNWPAPKIKRLEDSALGKLRPFVGK